MSRVECRSCWAVLILGILFFDLPARTPGQSVSQRPECTGVLHGTVSGRAGNPVPEFEVGADPLGVDVEGMLAHTTTNQTGEYRFEHLCPGTYSTFPDDQDAGYRMYGARLFEFLSGNAAQRVKLDSIHPNGEISFSLFPKPAQIALFVTASVEPAAKRQYSIRLNTETQPHRLEYEFVEFATVQQIAVPAERYFTLEVVAKGFHKWKWRIDKRKQIFLREGEQVKLEVKLDPVH
jgi:hypothetical protein